MTDDPTTGIPNPDKPGHWLVPPWPAGASFSAVVRHFLRFHPWGNTSTAYLLAYYEGYQAALDGAPTDEPTDAAHRRWRDEMRDCVGRCVALFQEKRAAEIQRPKSNIPTMPTAQISRHVNRGNRPSWRAAG